jgi:nucleoside-diphosphate-sugar epimerase
MKVIVVGTGVIGSAVRKALEEKGHEVVSVGRKSGDRRADICNLESLNDLFRVSAASMQLPVRPVKFRLFRSNRRAPSNG